MSTERTARETLAGRLLAEHEKHYSPAPTSPHPEDETLALFAEGRLSEPQLGRLIQHLADCGDCRSKAGLLLIASGEDADVMELPRRVIPWYRQPAAQFLAIAAALLLCLTGFLLLRRPSVDSIALAGSGKLTEFGIGIGGIVAREPAAVPPAARLTAEDLGRSPHDDFIERFNRGYLLLKENESAQGVAHFQTFVDQYPDDALAWLGLGTAHYLAGNLDAAAKSLEQSLSLAPDNLAARMNLAMSYDELGDREKAITNWRTLLKTHAADLTADERQQIEAQIRALDHTP